MTTPDEEPCRTVCFADLAGYTALTDAHGDISAADVAQRFFDLTAELLTGDARLVKTIGDAVMICTSDPRQGLQIGLDLLQAIEREPQFPGVRVGVHHGPVVERDDDIFGATVNVAARLTAHADVGQLLTSGTIASLLADVEHLTTVALGPTRLRNVAEPVEVHWVADHSRGATPQVLDPVCRMFVDADSSSARLPYGERIWHFCSFDCANSFVEDPDRHAAVPSE
jgi:class 3 adenylate cyclase/YHS domain-containing protein